MSAGKVFFDTNVLLYLYSSADPAKQARARELFREHGDAGNIVLSIQVVQEFFVAGLRKMALPRQRLRDAVSSLLDLPVVVIGPAQITKAIYDEERYEVSFWDSLILAAAESAGARILFTEDLNDGQQYGSVLACNPFRPVEGST